MGRTVRTGSGFGVRSAVGTLVVLMGLIAVVVGGWVTVLVIQSGPGLATPVPHDSGTTSSPFSGTGLVASLSVGQNATYSWSPDGAHLLVRDDSGSRLYDRSATVQGKFGRIEAWLDAEHLIDRQGRVEAISEPPAAVPTEYGGWVVANGHGTAAVIVAQPGCAGDPIVDWYQDGAYVRENEKVTPFGWTPNGKLALLGHYSCEATNSLTWQGQVDIVNFATRKIQASVTGVTGMMTLNPSTTRLAAQSGTNVEVVDTAGGAARTIADARLLGWRDDDHFYVTVGSTAEIRLVDASGGAAGSGAPAAAWLVPSPAGAFLEVDASGVVTSILGPGGKTALLDLASTDLVADPAMAAGQVYARYWTGPWSPDGRMVVLASKDGTSLNLFSVDPAHPGAVGSALPTPVGSPGVLVESHRTTLAAAATAVVADAKRNAFWFLGGAGAQAGLYRFDVGTAAITPVPVGSAQQDPKKRSLAIDPDGRVWVGGESGIVVYDPETGSQTPVALLGSGASIQTDPSLGRPDPWVSGIAFDAQGNALIARNWVRSLLRVDRSLAVLPGEIDVSDGFSMTGGMAVAGGMAYVLADSTSGLVFGVDASGSGKLFNTKMIATSIAACGDKLLAGGTPPGLEGADGGEAMIAPVMPSADVVAGGAGICALYDNASGMLQLRGSDGHVAGQAMFADGAAPKHVASIVFDAGGHAWALETTDGGSVLVRLDIT